MGQFRTQDGSPDDVYFLYDGRSVERSLSELPELASTITDAARGLGDARTRYAVVFIPMKITVLHSARICLHAYLNVRLQAEFRRNYVNELSDFGTSEKARCATTNEYAHQRPVLCALSFQFEIDLNRQEIALPWCRISGPV